MAHNSYARVGGLWTFNSPLTSAEMALFDLRQFQAINGDLGGVWAPSTLITIGGLGLHVTGQFTADQATITVPASNSITVDTGGAMYAYAGSTVELSGVVALKGTSVTTVYSGAAVTFNGGSTVTLNNGSATNIASGGTVTAANGSSLVLNGNISGTPTVTSGTITVNAATINCTASSSVTLAGMMTVASGGLMTCNAGGNITVNGTCAMNGTMTFGSGSTTTVASGANFTAASGSTTTLAGSVAVSGSVTRTGVETLSGNGAYRNIRVTTGGDANATYDARQFDIIQVPVLSALRIWTFSNLGPSDRVIVTIDAYRVTTGFSLIIANQLGNTIATFPASISGGQLSWDGSGWAKLIVSAGVT